MRVKSLVRGGSCPDSQEASGIEQHTRRTKVLEFVIFPDDVILLPLPESALVKAIQSRTGFRVILDFQHPKTSSYDFCG